MRKLYKATQRKQKFQHRLRFESLETRNLLSITMGETAELSGGLLTMNSPPSETWITTGTLVAETTTGLTLSGVSNLQIEDSTNFLSINSGTSIFSATGALVVVGSHQAPSGADNTINIQPELPYVFQASDFGFTDPADNDTFTRVKFSTLPTSGSLLLAGAPVAAEQFTAVEDIAAGNLKFSPAAGAAAHPTLTFQVEDDGGADPASNLDPTPRTITFNTPPVAQDDSYSVHESETLDERLFTSNLYMVSQPGDPIGNGQTYDCNETACIFTAFRDEQNGIHISIMKPVQTQPGELQLMEIGPQLYFSAPDGEELTPGTYSDAVYPSTQIVDKPSMYVAPNLFIGQIIGSFSGQFTVNQVEYGASGEVLSFDAAFEQHVELGLFPTDPGYNPAALIGRIQYHLANQQSIGILQNDADADGDALTAVLVAEPEHGSLVLNPDGGFVYTPTPGFNGTDSFQYKANDGNADSNIATVTIDVVPFSHAPQGTSGTVSVPAGPSYALQVADFGFTDPDDTPADGFIRVKITTLPATATLTLSGEPVTEGQFISVDDIAAGNLVLSPATGTPHINFTFQVEDSGSTENGGKILDLAPKTLTFDVPPVAVDDAYSVLEGQVLNLSLTGASILHNDTDPDGDALSVSFVSGPKHGTLSLIVNGSFTYTPDRYFYGTDSFQYKANDGLADGNVATVTIDVTMSSSPRREPTAPSTSYRRRKPYPMGRKISALPIRYDAPADDFTRVRLRRCLASESSPCRHAALRRPVH